MVDNRHGTTVTGTNTRPLLVVSELARLSSLTRQYGTTQTLFSKTISRGAAPGAFYYTHVVFRVSGLAALGPNNKLNTCGIYQIRIDLNTYDMCTYAGYITYKQSIV